MEPEIELDHLCDHCDYLRLNDRLAFVLKPADGGKGIVDGAFLLDDDGGVNSALIGIRQGGVYIGLDQQQANHLILLLRRAFPQGTEGEVEEVPPPEAPTVEKLPGQVVEGWAPPGWTQPRLPNVDVVPPWHPDRERP